MLSIGARAPEFTLPDQHGAAVSLTALLNAGPLILFFQPGALWPVCTRQACAIRDLHDVIVASGLQVAGINGLTPAANAEAARRLFLPFPLLSDADKVVTTMYDLEGPLGVGVRRATYLVTPGRIVRGAVLSDFSVADHERFIAATVAVQVYRPQYATSAMRALSSAVAAPSRARMSGA